jgi:DNA-binding NtrC family response regulator
MHKVLVVDDDPGLRMIVASALGDANYSVDQAQDGEEAVNKVRANGYNLVLLDVNMPRMDGLECLKQIKAYDPSIIVIILTAFSNVKDAIEATKEGAYNYLEKPIKAENLVYLVDRALRAHSMVKAMSLSAPVVNLPGGNTFVGQSAEMKKVFSIIEKLAKVDTAVLIRGESGTGKELVANAIHFNSTRKDERFVTVNCSAIPENLIESEFFGHEKGAFTGADSRKIGKFQYADGGTLFLDEIGDISQAMQVKLLRALQEKKFTPVGSNREIEVNVRIIAATNRGLEEMVKKGEFREDLFYRLNVLPIFLPPLRQRKDDIEHLTRYFVDKFNQLHRKNIKGLTTDAMAKLKSHDWPGNIRELENVIEHAFVIENTDQITTLSLPSNVANALTSLVVDIANPDIGGSDSDSHTADDMPTNPMPTPSKMDPIGFTLDVTKLDFQANKEEFERQFLISALKTFRGRINQTALHANIPKKTLLRKLEKYGINARDYAQ